MLNLTYSLHFRLLHLNNLFNRFHWYLLNRYRLLFLSADLIFFSLLKRLFNILLNSPINILLDIDRYLLSWVNFSRTINWYLTLDFCCILCFNWLFNFHRLRIDSLLGQLFSLSRDNENRF